MLTWQNICVYGNLLLVFTLSSNVAHSFLIISLGEIIEWIQIKLHTVNCKCSLIMMSTPMSVIRFAKDAKTIHIKPSMSLLISSFLKTRLFVLLYKVNDDFNRRKLKFPISVFIFIFKCPVKRLVQKSEISTYLLWCLRDYQIEKTIVNFPWLKIKFPDFSPWQFLTCGNHV